ncbi:MAG: MFS transporter [Firmicutes bacterium]|nr:MFS transporter [Bacillota bacterium]
MKTMMNLGYGSVHGFYWMSYGAICSFASVFLLACGYSNTDIGIMGAASNVAAVFLQPLMADVADRSKRFSLVSVSSIATVALMILCFGTLVMQQKSAALTVIFVLLMGGNISIQPLFNSLCFKLQECGVTINFGVGRSIGSLAYSILVMFLGTLAEEKGIFVLPLTAEITMALTLASLALVTWQFRKVNADLKECEESGGTEILPEEEDIDLLQFIKRNKIFMVLMFGVLGLYFSNGILNTFMLQVIQPLGGTGEDMGQIFSVMAFLEIPTMMFFEQINRKFSCQTLLKVAGIGYVVKTVMIWQATSVHMVLLAQFMQPVSFALMLPAIVKLIGISMSKGEAVKGQALFTTVTTVAYIVCSLVGGVILDLWGAGILMTIATVFTAAGAVVILLVVDKIKS